MRYYEKQNTSIGRMLLLVVLVVGTLYMNLSLLNDIQRARGKLSRTIVRPPDSYCKSDSHEIDTVLTSIM